MLRFSVSFLSCISAIFPIVLGPGQTSFWVLELKSSGTTALAKQTLLTPSRV